MLDKTQETNVVEKFENRPLSKHKVYKAVFRHLEITRRMSVVNPKAVLVTGVAGTGKTTVAKHYINELNEKAGYKKGVYIKLNSPKDIGPLIAALSESIFHLPPRLDVSDAKRRLFAGIINQDIKVFAIDEIQTILPAKKGSPMAIQMADFFKYLMEKTTVCLMMFGVKDAENLLTAESYKTFTQGQLFSRSNATIELPNIPPTQKWCSILSYLCKHTTVSISKNVFTSDVAARLFVATEGNFRLINSYFVAAHTLVDMGEFNEINYDCLSAVYHTTNEFMGENNPF
jgi:hypothetical protein